MPGRYVDNHHQNRMNSTIRDRNERTGNNMITDNVLIAGRCG